MPEEDTPPDMGSASPATHRQVPPLTPPWDDRPACPECSSPVTLSPGFESIYVFPDTDGEETMPAEEALSALNDCDTEEWAWCPACSDTVEVGAAAVAKARRAEQWACRPDRERAWVEVQRRRRVDAIAAEHARRQVPLFGGDDRHDGGDL